MKQVQKLILFIMIGLILVTCLLWQPKEYEVELLTDMASSKDEMRGIWIASVLNLDYPVYPTSNELELRGQIDEILKNVDAWGFNAIFLQVSPCADAIYKSEIYPWSAYLTGQQGRAPDSGFDPLYYWVMESHKRGLELHAWVNPFRVTREPSDWDKLASNSPAKQHTEWIVKYNENYYFDPALPQVRQLIVEAVKEIVQNYAVDGIHLDDYFYPGKEFDDAASYAVYGQEFTDIGDWRRNNINLLIHELGESLHDYDPELQFGIAPNAVWAEKSQREDGSNTNSSFSAFYDLYADTKYWVESEWLDYIAPQIYYENGHKQNDFTVLLDWWTDAVSASSGGGVKLYIGLADFKVAEAEKSADPWYNGAELVRQMNACTLSSEVAGTIHFRYRFIAESPELQRIFSQSAWQD